MIFDLARWSLGLLYFGFGLNGLFHFRPLPPMNPEMTAFNHHLQGTQIILPVVKIFEVVFGFALLMNQRTFLSTVTLAPISFFIVLAHVYFNRPKGFVISAWIGISQLILLFDHRVQLSFLIQR